MLSKKHGSEIILSLCVFLVLSKCCFSSTVNRETDLLSCENRCDENFDSNNPCHCNDQCKKYGNCCDDFIPLCATEVSCKKRCDESFNSSFPCHCNSACQNYKNCCEDYEEICASSTSCEGRCGETSKPSNSNCYCDLCCSQFGNCCDDFGDVCSVVVDEQYLCMGTCNVTRSRCSCMDDCLENVTCCSDYMETCLGDKPWKEDVCATAEEMKCPERFDSPPVILFSLDGFRADYIYREKTPNIWKLASCGVHAPYMRSAYPTLTFPNHYTIATGLYPESNGIVGNSMYDHDKKESFYLGSDTSTEPFWWEGEPIWVTTSNQGKKSATYFWVGSDVNITRYPDYWYPYDGSVPNQERMYQALDWLDMPAETRPHLILLYMDLVDHAGHEEGPDSEYVNSEMAVADDMIGILMDGLKLRGLENCVNLVLLADHGMNPQSCERVTNVAEYGVDLNVVNYYMGSSGRIGKSRDETEWNQFKPEKIKNQLRCNQNESHWQVFLKNEDLPKRFHYAKHKRIEDVHLLMDDKWLVEGQPESLSFCTGGQHGWDNEYKNMRALFTAHGPGFKRAFNTSEPFNNIEVYNLLTDLLDLNPAPNNGTVGSLYYVMSEPKKKEVDPPGDNVAVCSFEDATTPPSQGCTYCSGLSVETANERLKLTNAEADAAQRLHTPLGRHHVTGADGDVVKFCVLTQEDYVIAHDLNRTVAKYVTYTLEDKPRDLVKPVDCSRLDFRVYQGSQTSCSAYNEIVKQGFLYPPELSNGDAVHDAVINTNSAPMFAPARKVWDYMSLVFAGWASNYGGITLTSGPVFDYNYDGLADSDAILRQYASYTADTPIPTHYFIVALRCTQYANGKTITTCLTSPNDLDVISFIIPNYANEPCHNENESLFGWVPNTLVEHVARIRDVELITGISFFRDWTQEASSTPEERIGAVRAKLRLPEFSSQWVKDFLSEAPPTATEVTPLPDTTTEVTTTSAGKSLHFVKTGKLLLVSLFVFAAKSLRMMSA